MAKSAIEKLRTGQKPKIVDQLPERVGHWAPPGGSMVISTPEEVDGVIRQVKKGRLTTVNEIRDCLAKRHATSITCPVTTGIFISISARAAAEMEALGDPDIAPWWRVLKSDGALNEKYPGGVVAQRQRLEAEGHKIVARGRALVVTEFEKRLAKLRP